MNASRRAGITASVVSALSVAAVALLPAPAGAAVVDCPPPSKFSNVVVTSVRNMSCGAARRESVRTNRMGAKRFTTRGGFRCVRLSGGMYGGTWRCTRGAKAFRFSFGD